MAETCITATLVRGKVYNYNFIADKKKPAEGQYFTFHRNVPQEVSEELADELEDLQDVERRRADPEDEDVEEIERPLFRIDREAPVRRADEKTVKKVRMRLVAADEVRRPKPRPAPPGLKRRVG